MTDSLRVVVLGYIVRGPLGGLAWHHLQYVLGLTSLGHDVVFLETAAGDPLGCYDPSIDRNGDDPSYGLRFAAETFAAAGLPECWAYRHMSDGEWVGPAAGRVDRFCREADVLINVSGVNLLHKPYDAIPVRIFVDTDPVFQQVRVLTEPSHAEQVRRHTSLFTFAGCIDSTHHRVPDDGLPWRPTVQPVDLASWRPTPVPLTGALTTVMQWDSYVSRSWEGITYGMKAESFGPYIDLPSRVVVPLEIALGSASAPREDLIDHGWALENPLVITRSVNSYREYLASSLGEFSVAKHGYVAGRTGWFSERSANYLASGRPVVTQDTGFSQLIDCGEGLLVFSTRSEAIDAIESVAAAPQRHGTKAREVAAAHFDARSVIASLLDRAQ